MILNLLFWDIVKSNYFSLEFSISKKENLKQISSYFILIDYR